MEYIGVMIDPLVVKIFGASGTDVVDILTP